MAKFSFVIDESFTIDEFENHLKKSLKKHVIIPIKYNSYQKFRLNEKYQN